MNAFQRQYETGFRLMENIPKFSSTNYFKTLNIIRNRQSQYPTRKLIIKSEFQEPEKTYDVMKENKRLKLNIYNISHKPYIPKINTKFIKYGEFLRNNKERNRDVYNRALSLENKKYSNRIYNQKPIILKVKYLEKLLSETHDKYLEMIKNPCLMRKSFDMKNRTLVNLPNINSKRKRFKGHSKTEANLNVDNDQSYNNSIEMTSHGYSDISHQKMGNVEGKHGNNNQLNDSSG
jgi:hypothetical protein